MFFNSLKIGNGVFGVIVMFLLLFVCYGILSFVSVVNLFGDLVWICLVILRLLMRSDFFFVGLELFVLMCDSIWNVWRCVGFVK